MAAAKIGVATNYCARAVAVGFLARGAQRRATGVSALICVGADIDKHVAITVESEMGQWMPSDVQTIAGEAVNDTRSCPRLDVETKNAIHLCHVNVAVRAVGDGMWES